MLEYIKGNDYLEFYWEMGGKINHEKISALFTFYTNIFYLEMTYLYKWH